jgi:hypothetical protein
MSETSMKNNPVLHTTIYKYNFKQIIFILIGSEYFNGKKYTKNTVRRLPSS